MAIKRIMIHVIAPIAVSVIAGMSIEWNAIQIISFTIACVAFVHWLSIRFDWGAYDYLCSPVYGSALLSIFMLTYIYGFIFMPSHYVTLMSSFDGTYTGTAYPRVISMIIVALPIVPYVKLLVTEIFNLHNNNSA
jgi:hypothetical protein